MTILYVSKHEREQFFVARRLLLIGLGLVYLAAFWSLWVQVIGLVGEDGIRPAQEFFDYVAGRAGLSRLWEVPSWNWLIGASNGALHFLCAAGIVSAVAMMLGLAPLASAFICWSFYVSLYVAGQRFLSFQWDILLLEAGFLALFLTPPLTKRVTRETAEPSRLIIWLFWLLIFKLMFSSGVVKLSSGDPAWRDLTALSHHYETTCLPAWTGWLMFQLPMWFHKLSAVGMFAIELVLPFGIFSGRFARLIVAAAFVALMVFIGLTGNYGFFNLLTIVLCIPLLCDAQWPQTLQARWAPARKEKRPPAWPDEMKQNEETPYDWSAYRTPLSERPWPRAFVTGLTGFVLLCNIVPMASMFRPQWEWPKPLMWLHRRQSAFHIASNYGLFATMTTRRPEIVFEGSNDGMNWQAYELPYKPGNLSRRPGLYGLHMPRLDWLLWFAALSGPNRHPWTATLAQRLLQGEPAVLGLFARNPFPDSPPRYVRARLFEYHFTNWQSDSDNWWRREYLGPYLPQVQLGPAGKLQRVE